MSIDPFGAVALTIAVIAAGVYLWRASVAKKAKREALQRRLDEIADRDAAEEEAAEAEALAKAQQKKKRMNRGG